MNSIQRIFAAIIVLLTAAACTPVAPLVTPSAPQRADPLTLPPAGLPNGVAAGDVTQESVVLWARAAESGVVTFTLQTEAGAPVGEPLTRTVMEPLLPVTVTVANLSPQTTYHYQAQVANGDSASGTFRTPAEDGARQGLRFGAIGDVRGGLAPFPALGNAAARDLDFVVHLGDTVYADVSSPAVPKQAQSIEEFRLKHDEVHRTYYESNTVAALRASTAIFATIDDHELLNNFAGGAPASSSRFYAEDEGLINETRLYRTAMDAFLAYQPLVHERYGPEADARMAGRAKLYRYRTFGADGALFVLDVRSFRDAPLQGMTNLDDAATVAQFEQASFDASRTMLGTTQMADLQRDLLDAQGRGITWKFIVVSTPMQYLDMTSANDRWQGYAAERTELLRFIEDAGITNVVFITADIHGMVVNNLTYQTEAGGPHLPSPAWEIAIGAVAAYPPFGTAMFLVYREWGLASEADEAHYWSLPLVHDPDSEPDDRDDYAKQWVNEQMARYGFNPIGLDDLPPDQTLLDIELTQGDYMAGHVYGWSEFEIDAESQVLTITTYGIPAYVAGQMERDHETILARPPEVVSQLVVQPVR